MLFARSFVLSLLCCNFAIQAAELIPLNSTWRFLRGTAEASSPDLTVWRGTNFNDAAFADAPAPFWYGDLRTGGTQLLDMQNSYTCIFLRKTVSATNAAQIGGLRLNYFIDDGFIVWVNGTEVYRENVPDAPTIATLATNQVIDPAVLVSVTVFPPPGVLQDGPNVITIQAFNTAAGSSDFGFDCSIESLVSETVPPTIVSFTPPAGSRTNLTQITVTFSEPVIGVDADDLAIAGSPATGITGSGATYTFTFVQPTFGVVPITWETSHGITDLAAQPNAFNAIAPGAMWSYTLVDVVPPTLVNLFPQPGTTVSTLRQVEVTFSEPVSGVNGADLLINGQPATNVVAQPNNIHVFQFPQPTAGLVQILFASGHGIADVAPVPNAFAGASWSCTLDTSAVGGDLVITEINAANQSGLRDEDGEEQDWIEIHNRGSSPADLAAWSLSDDADLTGQWIFPSKVLSANQYLVVFASGKNRKAPTGTNRFHVNFTLANDGEFLGLFNSDSPRLLVSGFGAKYPVQRNNYSYGTDAGGNLRYFATPTPGASNGTSTITGVAQPVHFSSPRGHYAQPFDLALSCPTPGAVIRFTRDGSEPTEVNGALYLGPLRLTNTTLLRAAAYRSGHLVSKVTSHSFFFGLTAANLSLPTLSIMTHSNNLLGRTGIIGMSGGTGPPNNAWTATSTNDYFNPTNQGIAWERPVSVEYIDPADNSGFQVDAGIRVQGSDWTRPRYQATSKFSYRLYFRGDYGSGRLEYPLMPTGVVDSFDQIVLRAGHNDETNPYITDELVRQLFADQGQVSVHGTFVNFWLNGVLKQYYNPCERVEEGFLQSWHGGGKSWDILTVGSAVQGGDNVAWNSLRTYVSGQNVQLPSVYQEIERRMDVTNFVDYLILNTYGATWDWPHNNWRAARERAPGGRFRFYVWDAEGAFGFTRSTPTFDSFSTTDSGLLPPSGTAEIPRFYQGLLVSPEFRLLWADRVQKHFFNNGALADTNITKRFLELRAKVLPVIAGFDNKYLTTWIPQRRAPLLSQYLTYGLMASSNAPIFSKHGGTVPPGYNLSLSLSNATGTIYFTRDGSDPRVRFSGAVSNSAVAYTTPIPLDQSVLVKARTLSGTNWSAVTEAVFEVGTQGSPLRITEIHYNPPGGSVHEFIELQNFSGAPVALSGSYFDEGIAFTFPAGASIGAGARLLLANNTDTNAFAIRYPGVIIAGYFGGNLNNSGERLTLRNAAGQIIVSVDYKDSGGWPVAADGGGATLELVSPHGDPDDAANWVASTQAGGTPGTAPTSPAPSAIRLSEIMAENLGAVNNSGTFPDWIELQNTSGTPVNIAGWSVSNDGDPRKFVIPANTTIPAGGFLVIWCDAATNTSPGLHAGYSLDRSGDSVFLYDPATNRMDAIGFGPQIASQTIGVIAGEWQLNQPTANAANQAASVGPAAALSINEWLANALPGQPDWIELYNSSALPAPLKGCYLATTNAVHRLSSLSFIGGNGFVQFLADEGVGPDHLDFKLPAAAAPIVLYGPAGEEINRVSYTGAIEGVTRGRLPDGAASLVDFPGSASPGASNYVNSWTGPYLNEVLARNTGAVTNGVGRTSDFIEIFNPAAVSFDLSGLSLSIGSPEPREWSFPTGTVIAAQGYLVVWCDEEIPATTNAGSFLNTGRSLDGDSDGVYLFEAAGRVVSFVEYGAQVANLALGRVGVAWRALSSVTPGATNSAAATLGPATALRVNEWMADGGGDDWFELFNMTNRPVDLGGLCLSDDLTLAGQAQHRIPLLSFIAPRGWVKFIADGNPDASRVHVNFSLDASGDSIRLSASNLVTIDTVAFGHQLRDISEGRWPDGATNVVGFPGSASPGAGNYRLIDNVEISEILPHNPAPLEAAIELHNSSAAAANIGGWYLSDSATNFLSYRIPDGTILPANGRVVIYESAFNPGAPGSFSLSIERGGEVWLTSSSSPGVDGGYRARLAFGPSIDGVSHGARRTSVGVDETPLAARTFGVDNPATVTDFRQGAGLPNAGALVGPIVINEIMVRPPALPNSSRDDEYIELHNPTGAEVLLHRPSSPTNHWRLTGAVEFEFASDARVPAGGYLLVANFDPVNDPVTLAAFRARHGIGGAVPIVGPYRGKLDNAGEDLRLLRFGTPQGPPPYDPLRVPEMLADRVNYQSTAPWPAGLTDGGGASLQRRQPLLYGNEPTNWVASAPTPGAANGAGLVLPPSITLSPPGQTVMADSAVALQVSATGAGPLSYQWRFNGRALADATNASLVLQYLQTEQTGLYDAVVSNPGGSAVSTAASLLVLAVPELLQVPVSKGVALSSNTVFSVFARGTEPLAYQWRFKGVPLFGANTATLTLTNLQLSNDGSYEVIVSNVAGQASAEAYLTVLQAAAYVVRPASNVVAVAGGNFTVSAAVLGNPTPYTFSWRRITPSTTWTNVVQDSKTNFMTFNTTALGLTLANNQPWSNFNCRLVIANAASTGNGLASSFTVTVLADSDLDGLPDAWETTFEPTPGTGLDPALDADLDGLSNGEEFLAGTDPTNPASVLAVNLVPEPGGPAVLFGAISNRTYTVQFTDALASPWQKLGDLPAQSSNRVEILSDPLWRTNRFYRVVTPWQP